ncbi:MAG: hypothetical protein HRU18_02930 [Pseudoalteromonas sp.]|uniref:hypothetical protein n=1 Tax=Pseudoalteromonas sp. TaxID=53249 RepID=UPI001DE1F6A7|nr:hypothetical protein [Pseudoalteromonas sp.]NRA77139.1 hypothetical protein [Pseudoalteromonas sp.]
MTVITNADLTDKRVGGSGIFDELMTTVNAHLQEEFSKKRITGTDYSKVYLGAMQSVMSQSIQFLLQKEISANQADLLAEQIKTQVEQTATLTKALVANGLLDKQVLSVVADINQTDAQTTLLGTQNTKTGSENALVLANELKVDAEKLVVDAQLANVTQGTLTEVQKTALTTEQVAAAQAETASIIEKTLGMALNRTDILPAQATKLINEAALVIQKHQTEKAQTSNTLIDGTTVVAGNSGAQKALQDKQAEGYDRNSEYKLTKLMLDTFNVGVGSAAGTRDAATAGVNDAEIKQVLDAARSKMPGFENT